MCPENGGYPRIVFSDIIPVQFSVEKSERSTEYSRLGDTHHLAISYGMDVESTAAFGRTMGWDTEVID